MTLSHHERDWFLQHAREAGSLLQALGTWILDSLFPYFCDLLVSEKEAVAG